MANTWVLVADSASARLFSAATPTGPLEELESLTHREGRMHPRELTSDLPGRAFDSAGQGRHAMESHAEPQKQEAIAFARRLAERLDKARSQGEIERLIVVAAPAFLGLLRDHLGMKIRRLVEAEFALNLVRLAPNEIRGHLPEKLFATIGPR